MPACLPAGPGADGLVARVWRPGVSAATGPSRQTPARLSSPPSPRPERRREASLLVLVDHAADSSLQHRHRPVADRDDDRGTLLGSPRIPLAEAFEIRLQCPQELLPHVDEVLLPEQL